MQTLPALVFLRMLLILLGVQKSMDALLSILHPPTAYAFLKLLGFVEITTPAALQHLLPQLWGCASLAWAYFLLRAAADPQGNRIIVEGSVLGFLAAGLVALFTPMPWVRVIGILFLVEASLLLMGRLRLDRPSGASQEPA